MRVLELFAGSRSIGKVAESLGFEVYSSDIQNFDGINYSVDILDFDPTLVPFTPDIIWASPPCTFFSVASIGYHWHKDNSPKSANAIKGVEIVAKTLEIINFFLDINPDLIWFVENPTGKLRKLPIVRGEFDRATVNYCKYGDDRFKSTDIWTNNLVSIYNPKGWRPRSKCYKSNKNCKHQPAPRGSRTGTQGRQGSYDRSKLPPDLCLEILSSSLNK